MIEFDNFPEDSAIFCPRCGVKNIPSYEDMEDVKNPEILIKDCEHFIFFGLYDPSAIIDKEHLCEKFEKKAQVKSIEEYAQRDEAPFYTFLKESLNDDFLIFNQSQPAPSGMTSLTIYNLRQE